MKNNKKKTKKQQQQQKKQPRHPSQKYSDIVLCLQRPCPPPAPAPAPPPPIFFHLEKLSAVVFCCARIHVQFYLMVSVCIIAFLMYVYMYVCLSLDVYMLEEDITFLMCVCVYVQISSLKPLGQLKPNSIWNLHGIGEDSLFKFNLSFVYMNRCPCQSICKRLWLVVLLFYGPTTLFRPFRARSVYLSTLFLDKPPRQFTNT